MAVYPYHYDHYYHPYVWPRPACPDCGYCPTCGRYHGARPRPYVRPVFPNPYYKQRPLKDAI